MVKREFAWLVIWFSFTMRVLALLEVLGLIEESVRPIFLCLNYFYKSCQKMINTLHTQHIKNEINNFTFCPMNGFI
jgi:hypothetical protein